MSSNVTGICRICKLGNVELYKCVHCGLSDLCVYCGQKHVLNIHKRSDDTHSIQRECSECKELTYNWMWCDKHNTWHCGYCYVQERSI